jgi:hypothetical protein
MDLTHVHLLLNHFPTIGTIIGLGLLIVSLIGKSEDLKRASLVVFLGIALLTIPTYVTGNAAQESMGRNEGVSKTLIETHEAAALQALPFMELTGALAWLGLWQFRRVSRLSKWNTGAVVVLSIVTLGLMARAADMGGEIRHPEIRALQQAATTTEKPMGRELGSFVVGVTWVWPTCETLHFIGMALLFGVAAVVDLRMLGMVKALSFASLHRLLPWGMLGFGINLITGMLFFVAAPGQYAHNPAFEWKVILMLLAGANVLYFTVFNGPWAVASGEDAPFTTKLIAGSAILILIGVMYCGRMLPFIGNAF